MIALREPNDRTALKPRAMLYQLYQAQADLLYPARQMARLGALGDLERVRFGDGGHVLARFL